MIDIPALKYKADGYPTRFWGRVPKRIRMLKTVSPALPFRLSCRDAREGLEYEAWTNSYGAVAVMFDGTDIKLGVKPDEFEIIEWFGENKG